LSQRGRVRAAPLPAPVLDDTSWRRTGRAGA